MRRGYGMARLISCPKCGKIHKEGECTKKAEVYGRKNQTRKYRTDRRWHYARKQALERDLYCCRMCLADGRIERERLEVHHIIPLYKDASMAYDIDNLITLCNYHHRMVEDNEHYTKQLREYISSDVLFKL